MMPVPQPSRLSHPVALIITALVASTALGIAAVLSRPAVSVERNVDNRPIEVVEDGFVSSATCRSCHPSQYETWYGSFHRTMTQVATQDSVRADFDGVDVVDVHGRPMRLERRGDEFWAEFDDPGVAPGGLPAPRIQRRVVMITGSHHQQIYWYATGHDRGLNVLPGVFLLDDRRWVPRSAVVMHPPDQRVATLNGHWNAICIACHTTLPKTAFDTPFGSQPFEEQSIDTTSAEFGIACEACHGPGEAHLRSNQGPIRRYRQHLGGEPDPTIVDPSQLAPERASQVCGQCHSVWEFFDAASERVANAQGLPYRPGDDLEETRFIAQPMHKGDDPIFRRFLRQDPDFVRGSFWDDGMVRVSGREYNGLLDSPCFRNASEPEHTLTCSSCHTMHKTPDDPRSVSTWASTHQVSSDMNSNTACLQCHASLEADVPAHTKHAADSTGSLCYNCHMPYTSYGLLKAVRSHTVSSPSVTETTEVGRPNACNLCHLDKTLDWTGQALNEWYGTVRPVLSAEESSVAASLLWMLQGDAGSRALTAWSLGWQPAQEASGTSWMVPHLTELLNDPYDAVRYISYRSLRSLPGYETYDYNYLGTREDRINQVLPVLQAWQAGPLARRRLDPELLVNPDGSLRTDEMRQLFDRRDNRRLFLRE